MKLLCSNIFKICLLVLGVINSCTSISDLKHLAHRNNYTHQQVQQQQHDKENFLIIDHLNDNEKETRLKWKDLMGKETTLDMDNNERFVNR